MNQRLWLVVLLPMLVLACGSEVWAKEKKKDEAQAAEELNLRTSTVTPTEVVAGERVFSMAEVQMLTELDARRVAMDRREQALQLREKLVDVLEQRLNARVGELSTLKSELERLLKSLSGKDDQELQQLAAMYGGMKPTVAATVLNRLDNAIVLDVLTRMPAKKSGKIMESLDPAKARVLSEMMAAKTPVPVVKGAEVEESGSAAQVGTSPTQP